jgi:hypothetical protein
LPRQAAFPDPLVAFDGTPIASQRQWERKRAPELKQLFQHYMYGYFPPAPKRVKARMERRDPALFNGKATKKEIELSFGPPATPTIHLLLVVPNQRRGPAPVVLGLNFCGNYATLMDPSIPLPTNWMPNNCAGCTNNQATEAGRGRQLETWSIEQAVGRGYAVATFYHGDVDPDRPDFSDGVHPHILPPGPGGRGPTAWACLAAWAWGLHRVVDYLHTDRDIDRDRIAVMGHSRNGKTALLAAAFDDRIDLVLPHQAGCGGTAPSRGTIGETVKQINDRFPHWFSGTFKQFNEQVDRLPFDQHALIALCAPRPVLLSNALEDSWANPEGQFEMLRAADPVYQLLGVDGLGQPQPPPVGHLLDSRLGYFIRPGRHSTTREDWTVFLNFADKHFGLANRGGSKR